MTNEYASMKVTVDDNGVADVLFAQGSRGNPIDQVFCDDMSSLSVALATNAKIRVVLFRAEGKAFSFGGDLGAFHADLDALPAKILAMTGTLHAAIVRLQRMNAPLIGAIHGVCAGGMTAFMAGCDLLVAAEEAKFLAAYAGIGFSCDAGSSIMLTRRMGLARARRYLLLNETLDARSALTAGLVDEVVTSATLAERSRALVAQLATGPTRAFGETRRLLASASDQPLETQLELEAQALARIATSHDAREGITAFVGKRKPAFTGT